MMPNKYSEPFPYEWEKIQGDSDNLLEIFENPKGHSPKTISQQTVKSTLRELFLMLLVAAATIFVMLTVRHYF